MNKLHFILTGAAALLLLSCSKPDNGTGTGTGNGNGTGNVYLAYNTLNIPEPTSSMLGLVGMVALSFRRRRK
jgi:hypothetical protein